MPLLNIWWNIKSLYNNICGIKKVFKNNRKKVKMEYEYKVVKLGSSAAKNAEMLNKQSAEGWFLVSTSPVSRIDTRNGAVVNDIQAFLRRQLDTKSNTIIG